MENWEHMETNDSESKMLGERCIFLLCVSAISVAISDFKRKKFIFNKGVMFNASFFRS